MKVYVVVVRDFDDASVEGVFTSLSAANWFVTDTLRREYIALGASRARKVAVADRWTAAGGALHAEVAPLPPFEDWARQTRYTIEEHDLRE
jgi:hypothetical protein